MRYLGISKPNDYSTSLMFAAGEKNEDSFIDVLQAADCGEILTQSEAATKWEVAYAEPNGELKIDVTGSPDIVVRREGKLDFGVELKLICSYWTARDVGPYAKRQPKLSHLAQALHYMWQLGKSQGQEYLPYYLTYVNRMNWMTMGYKDFPEEHPSLSFNEKGKPYKMSPFYSHYELKIGKDEMLYYRHTEGNDWQRTALDVAGIKEYYKLLAECLYKKVLPPRMDAVDTAGFAMTYDPYSPTYNPWAELHDRYDQGSLDFDGFVGAAKQMEDES